MHIVKYIGDPYIGARRKTREVRVGGLGIGGDNPIRVQSMTNTDTMNTQATVEQIIRLRDAGCEIARVTAPSIRDAENLKEIKRQLGERGVEIPLVADIHFTPNAALIAANLVEKVRINPGNYADKKSFAVREYTDAEYDSEVERVADRFRPLVVRCRENGVAMRIGTNHGSLSDRIMNRHGDSPLGMVESALEFLDVCEDERYYDVVFSMKASNTHVAIAAYRLLAARLAERDGDEAGYPFHLGVTEAGDAEDGRIKSAIGIGSLLEDGIGDTIRVSLTEDPVKELPVAKLIAARAERRWQEDGSVPSISVARDFVPNPYEHERRATRCGEIAGLLIGGGEPVRVELDLGPISAEPAAAAERLAADLEEMRDVACELLLVSASDEAACRRVASLHQALEAVAISLPLAVRIPLGLLANGVEVPPGAARVVVPADVQSSFSAMRASVLAAEAAGVSLEWELRAARDRLPELIDRALQSADGHSDLQQLFSISPLASMEGGTPVQSVRLLAAHLGAAGASDVPIVLRFACDDAPDDGDVDLERTLVEASVEFGGPLCDGIGDAISLAGFEVAARAVDIAYRILQGARLRTTRTEYISCPSCGRTLFDLEETTARIKAMTDHLKGLKIGIMGCIVNGPGEMADADFGYVGSGVGLVTLYVGKDIVARRVPEQQAPERLLALIREHGRWVEPAAIPSVPITGGGDLR